MASINNQEYEEDIKNLVLTSNPIFFLKLTLSDSINL